MSRGWEVNDLSFLGVVVMVDVQESGGGCLGGVQGGGGCPLPSGHDHLPM